MAWESIERIWFSLLMDLGLGVSSWAFELVNNVSGAVS